jgi:cytochrome c biogenesis protein CcmG/thiol:disulfide interchange protein DsbE
MKRRFLLLVAAALLAGCARTTSASAAVKAEKDRKTAPAFALKDVRGGTVSLADLKGKVVLLNFWATWCGPCKIEIPWFVDFEQRYRDQGLAVVGVSMDEDGWDTVKPYIESKKVNYRVVLGDDKTAELYGGVESLPTTFLIDAEGKIASVHVGLVSKDVYDSEIRQLLKARKSRAAAGGADAGAGGARN